VTPPFGNRIFELKVLCWRSERDSRMIDKLSAACCLQQLSVVTIIEILFLLILLQHYRNLFRRHDMPTQLRQYGKIWSRMKWSAGIEFTIARHSSASSSPRLYGASGRGVAATKPSFTINAAIETRPRCAMHCGLSRAGQARRRGRGLVGWLVSVPSR